MGNAFPNFTEQLRTSLRDGTFVGLVLSDPRATCTEGLGVDVRRVDVRRVDLKKGEHLQLVLHEPRRDVTQNLAPDAAIARIEALLGAPFCAARLRTTAFDAELRIDAKGRARLARRAATRTTAPSTSHDRSKTRLVGDGDDRVWLDALGLTHEGRPRAGLEHKVRQIHRYVEITSGLLRGARLPPAEGTLRVVDMGAGKGYLTFALAAYLKRIGARFEVVGVESRTELALFCNDVASRAGFSELSFRAGRIDDAPLEGADMVVALHACDTATDDALARGVRTGARLLVCAPCCQQELHHQLHATGCGIDALLSHGILASRQADLVTDTVRALVLEASGYRSEVFEFVDAEHTPKNLMIAATRVDESDARAERRRARARERIESLKKEFGFKTQRLADRLLGES